jgi:hypothetical protein
MNEQTPLLNNAKKPACEPIQKAGCCSFKNSDSAGSCCSQKTKPCSGLPPVNDDDYCYLSEQKWEYKLIALACAIFLAGKYYEKRFRS